MKRREFLHTTAAVGAAIAGAACRSPALERGAQGLSREEADDRSPQRDVWQVQRSTIVVNGCDPSELSDQYLKMLKEGGVNCQQKSVGAGGVGDIQLFADLYNFLDGHSDKIVPVTKVAQIREAYRQDKIALVFGWQSASQLGEARGEPATHDLAVGWKSDSEPGARSPEPPPTALRAYYQLGIRVIGIAYQASNIFGGGVLDPEIGLTHAGRRLVEEIHKLGLVLDLGGHNSEKTSMEAIEMSPEIPVISSHTNVASIVDNIRCISDRLMEAIAKTGGVIGISAISDYHVRSRKDAHIPRSPHATLEQHLDQFDYIRKLIGVDHIGLGPDFVVGRSEPQVEAEVDRSMIPKTMVGEPPWLFVKGFEDITELPNVTRGLIERGWSTEDIHKVLGGNWLRVYEKIWGG